MTYSEEDKLKAKKYIDKMTKEIEGETSFVYVSEESIISQQLKNIPHCYEKLLASAIVNFVCDGKLDYEEFQKAIIDCLEISLNDFRGECGLKWSKEDID